jgi:hypothetical protein
MNRSLLRLGALGASLSTLFLLGMAFISLPGGMFYPGLPALTGSLPLSPAEQTAYLAGMRLLFVLDGFFLAGWLAAWVGLFHLVRGRLPLLGGLTLAFGLAGALFDFSENSLIWGALQTFQSGQMMTPDWLIAWKAVQHLSYWLPFLGALFAAPALWQGHWAEKAAALVGSALLVPAVIGLYFPDLILLPNLWFLLWFLALSLILWRAQRLSDDIPSPYGRGAG